MGFFNNVLSSLTVACPITSIANGRPLHAEIAGATWSRDVCLEQIRSLDLSVPARSARKPGAIFGI